MDCIYVDPTDFKSIITIYVVLCNVLTFLRCNIYKGPVNMCIACQVFMHQRTNSKLYIEATLTFFMY